MAKVERRKHRLMVNINSGRSLLIHRVGRFGYADSKS